MWNTRGWILGEFGVHEAADEANRRCVEIARQLGPQRFASELIGNAEANLADVALARSDLPGAEAHLAVVAAVRDAKTLGNPPQIWHAGLALGRVLHGLGRRDEATTTWRDALDVVEAVARTVPEDLRASLLGAGANATLQELTA